MWILYLVGGYLAFCALAWVVKTIEKIELANKEKERVEKLEKEVIKEKERVEKLEKEVNQRRFFLRQEQTRIEALKVESKFALEQISKEKALGFPWLATAYSEYLKLFDLKIANELENKERPAKRAAEEVRAMSCYESYIAITKVFSLG